MAGQLRAATGLEHALTRRNDAARICGNCINAVRDEFHDPLDPDAAGVAAREMGREPLGRPA